MKIDFEEKTHQYKIDGRIVPSVTKIIKGVIGCGWKAEDWYLTRGRAIHACADLIARGKDFKFDERLSGYIEAIKKFFKEVEPCIFASEYRVGSKTYSYAGTIDLMCVISGKNCLIDWKHSIDKNRIPLQLGGYSAAYDEMFKEKINIGYGVQIKENGTYSMTEAIDLKRSRAEFLTLRTVYGIKIRCGEKMD